MKWQTVVTGERACPVVGPGSPRLAPGASRGGSSRQSARRLPAHACLALLMLGSVIGSPRP